MDQQCLPENREHLLSNGRNADGFISVTVCMVVSLLQPSCVQSKCMKVVVMLAGLCIARANSKQCIWLLR